MSTKSVRLSADLRDIAHITPIACPTCKTGKASLIERRTDGRESASNLEIWVFECDGCGAMSVQPTFALRDTAHRKFGSGLRPDTKRSISNISAAGSMNSGVAG